MARYGRTQPDDTRGPATRPVMADEVATYLRENPGCDSFDVLMNGPHPYTGPVGQRCAFQPVANRKDPRPKRWSDHGAPQMNAVDTHAKAVSGVFGRSSRTKITQDDIEYWRQMPIFVLVGFHQTPLDRGRAISHENLQL